MSEITLLAIAIIGLSLWFSGLYFISIKQSEKYFIYKERCIKSNGRHDVVYEDLDVNRQQLRCTKCNKAKIISK